MITLPNGDLIASGNFTTAGSPGTAYIARWDGTQWVSMGGGADWWVYALTLAPNGDLIAGGFFYEIGGIVSPSIARWDGVNWNVVNSAESNPHVFALVASSNGDYVLGGVMSFGSCRNIIRLTSNGWQPLGTGLNNTVCALAELRDGSIVAGGVFNFPDGAYHNHIARWNGTAWVALNFPGSVDYVGTMAVLPNGDLVIGGNLSFSVNGVLCYGIARWDGSQWLPFGTGATGLPAGASSVGVWSVMACPNGDLIAGGTFKFMDGTPANCIARWNGTTWSPFDSGLNSGVGGTAIMPNGDIAVGGSFTSAGSSPSNYFARWTDPSMLGITAQPVSRSSCSSGGSSTFSVTAGGGSTNYYAWQIQTDISTWIDLTTGPQALPCGGTVMAGTPHNAATTISIDGCTGNFNLRCLIQNDCGTVISDSATLTICDLNADINCSGVVELGDLATLLSNFGLTPATHAQGDLNADNTVDLSDLAYLLANFGQSCP